MLVRSIKPTLGRWGSPVVLVLTFRARVAMAPGSLVKR
jgi:hypothetical protein